MPWELIAIKYPDAAPPSWDQVDRSRLLPLGAVEEVQQRIMEACPSVEWQPEPSHEEMDRLTSRSSLTDAPAGFAELYRLPRIRGVGLLPNGTLLEFWGLYRGVPVKVLHIDIRWAGNPSMALRRLCGATGWSLYEWCRGRAGGGTVAELGRPRGEPVRVLRTGDSGWLPNSLRVGNALWVPNQPLPPESSAWWVVQELAGMNDGGARHTTGIMP
jgi:hypothetical protein